MKRFKPILVIAVLFAFLFSPALAERGNFISPDQVDLVKILAPPPANDSPQTQAEIQELIRIQEKRTSREEAAANDDVKMTIFQVAGDVLGPRFRPENLPVAAKFFERLGQDEGFIVSPAKDTWNRPRPVYAQPEDQTLCKAIQERGVSQRTCDLWILGRDCSGKHGP
jgi:acid phosphatase (class A)